MKSYEVVGYVYEGEAYDVQCFKAIKRKLSKREDAEVGAIFAGDEWDGYPTCGACGNSITEVSLTDDGVLSEARRQNIEIFYTCEDDAARFAADMGWAEEDPVDVVGWYWWCCFPGCLPESDPIGPFRSEIAAARDAIACDY